jgi:hypothetical protein
MKNLKKQQQTSKLSESMNILNAKQRLINYIDSRINYFSGGDEMKSLNESIRDEMFVRELNNMKKTINDGKF